MSIQNRVYKNGTAAIFSKGTKVAEQLLLVPFFITFWGPSYYGEWLTLSVIPSILSLSDFGFGSAAANAFLLKYARGDQQGAINTSKTGFFVLTWFILIAIILSICIVYLLKVLGAFKNIIIPADDAILAIILLLISKIINFYQILFEAYFRAARKANKSINFMTYISLVNIVAGFVVLQTGGKVVLFSFVSVIVACVMNPIYVLSAKRTLNINPLLRGVIIKNEIIQLIRIGFGYLLAPIWQAVYFQGCTFVVRLMIGPVAVTIFNTVRSLIRSSSQAFSIVIIAIYPDFQFELACGNLKQAKKLFFSALLINIILSIFFICALALYGEYIYSIWIHKSLHLPSGMWLIFLFSIIFYALWFTFSFVFEALNKPFTYTFASLICALICVSISWYLSKILGLTGAAIGNSIFDIMMCIYLIPIASKHMNFKFSTITQTFTSIFQNLVQNLALKRN
jgi:O-antigen/teichoic acid export membrane protein